MAKPMTFAISILEIFNKFVSFCYIVGERFEVEQSKQVCSTTRPSCVLIDQRIIRNSGSIREQHFRLSKSRVISEHRSINTNNIINIVKLRMQQSVNVTMEKRLALEVNTNKGTLNIPRFSTFANHLSSMISCPDFSDRGTWGQKVMGTEVGAGVTIPRRTVADTGYRMDDNFKLAFLLNDSY